MNLFHVTYYPKSDATKPTGIQWHSVSEHKSIMLKHNIFDEVHERLDSKLG